MAKFSEHGVEIGAPMGIVRDLRDPELLGKALAKVARTLRQESGRTMSEVYDTATALGLLDVSIYDGSREVKHG